LSLKRQHGVKVRPTIRRTVTQPALPNDTFPRLLAAHAARQPAAPAIREKDLGIWQTWTWADVATEVREIACGLASLGFQPFDNLAIVGANRPHLYMAVLAAQSLRGVPVPLYQDAVASEMVFMLDDAGIEFVFAEDQEQVDKLLECRDLQAAAAGGASRIRHIVYDDPKGLRHYDQPGLIGYDRLRALGRAFDAAHPGFFDAAVASGEAGDVAVILYTSGTTGRPKGVCQTHASFIAAGRGGVESDRLGPGDGIMSYLPMAWVGDHLFSVAQWLVGGFTLNCPESAETVMNDMREIGPSYYFGPPRTFEGLLTAVSIRMEDAAAPKRWLYAKFMALARRVGAEILNGAPVSTSDRLLYGLGNLLMYGPLRNVLGMSRIRVAYTAGAAIGPTCSASTARSASTSSSSTARPRPAPTCACSRTARSSCRPWAPRRRASNSRSPATARCWCAACRCSRNTTSGPRPPPRCSTPKATSTPATPACSTARATCASSTAPGTWAA
jgi:long-chain acyl-CoA synthetase